MVQFSLSCHCLKKIYIYTCIKFKTRSHFSSLLCLCFKIKKHNFVNIRSQAKAMARMWWRTRCADARRRERLSSSFRPTRKISRFMPSLDSSNTSKNHTVTSPFLDWRPPRFDRMTRQMCIARDPKKVPREMRQFPEKCDCYFMDQTIFLSYVIV